MLCVFFNKVVITLTIVLSINLINLQTDKYLAQVPDEKKEISEKEIGERQFLEVPRYPRPDKLFDWGGWFRTNLYIASMPPLQNGQLYTFDDLKLWFNFDINNVNTFYARFHEKLRFYDNQGDTLGTRTTNWIGPNVDVAYNRLLLWQSGQNYINFTAGRKYFFVGNGVSLYNKLDGVEFNIRVSQYLLINTFVARTIRTTGDFDFLRPNATRSERLFAGTQLHLSIFPKNPIIIYYLQQFDNNNDKFTIAGQDFLYDSWYLGLHSTGKLLLPEFSYNFEFIWEGGKSSPKGVKGKTSSIKAWANVTKLEYYPSRYISKIFLSNYWASGDPDRIAPRTSALGNAAGTSDTAFGYFGFAPTGLAFFPYLSNIVATSTGFTLNPFKDNETSLFKNLNCGATFFIYHKDKKNGGIYDSLGATVTKNKRFLGSAIEAFLSWKILSDLSFNTDYSIFFPSDTFTSTEKRTFLIFGLLYEF